MSFSRVAGQIMEVEMGDRIWDEDKAVDMIRQALLRINDAMPKGYEIDPESELWDRLDAAVDAAIEAKDMKALDKALKEYEQTALDLFSQASKIFAPDGAEKQQVHTQPSSDIADPRPDIHWDTDKWTLLLRWAADMDQTLYENLLILRRHGLRLIWGKNGWTMQAIHTWDRSVSYQELRTKLLVPYKQQLIELLNRLSESAPVKGAV